jgi:hypothetical protein
MSSTSSTAFKLSAHESGRELGSGWRQIIAETESAFSGKEYK